MNKRNLFLFTVLSSFIINSASGMTSVDKISEEKIYNKMVSFCDKSTLLSLRQVNKKINAIAEEELLENHKIKIFKDKKNNLFGVIQIDDRTNCILGVLTKKDLVRNDPDDSNSRFNVLLSVFQQAYEEGSETDNLELIHNS